MWTPGATDDDVWRIHSTVILEDMVNCIDIRAGDENPIEIFSASTSSHNPDIMCMGTMSGVAVYQLDSSGDLLIWRHSWSLRRVLPQGGSSSGLIYEGCRSTVLSSISISLTASHIAAISPVGRSHLATPLSCTDKVVRLKSLSASTQQDLAN